MTSILGISAFYHDSAAALVVDGEVVAAAQEERFSRDKHDERFPERAIEYCLAEAGLDPSELDYVGFYDKPLLKFERLLETYLAYAPAGFASFSRAMPLWLQKKLHLPREMRRGLAGRFTKRFVFAEHHESHAASAFFPSPFERAAVLTLDGVGEWATASFGVGEGNRISLSHELRFPHSLGLLYSAFTYFCGFEVNSGEYKLMGLAPYGEPRYADLILDEIVDLKADGSFRLDMACFNYCQGLTMTSKKLHRLLGGPPRSPGDPITEREMDVAASIQRVTEEVMLRAARHLHERTGLTKLCLAGGVALNCVGNGRILREGPYDEIWIQPAAGDAGGALGVALLIWHQLLGEPRIPSPADSQKGSLLGPAYPDEEIGRFLDSRRAVYRRVTDEEALHDEVAAAIAEGSVVGWFQGRMEFGPRALGSRSILADARGAAMQATINQKVKFREGFRPFAPVVLREHAGEYFQVEPTAESPYMLLVVPVREDRRLAPPHELRDARGLDRLNVQRSEVPAITHVDHSARVQTVDPDRHGPLRALMEAFQRKTGCPVMVNTSFNLGWEPIVRSPAEAYETFMSSGIDVLCMGRHVLTKAEQPATLVAAPGREVEARRRALREVLRSPCHGAPLDGAGLEPRCSECGARFAGDDEGIPNLFWPHDAAGDPGDVTEQVKAFYEEHPFPDYDDHESLRSLIDKARRGRYAEALDRSIPYNATVLEVGCGTGQLSNFLGISCRRVVGTDLCRNSLRLGEAFRATHGLDRVWFVQMNLFRPCFGPHQFDVILCNGVLHHTSEPFGGFRGLLPLLKPGGHVVIGLYNRYGRWMTDVRRGLYRLSRGRGWWLDPVLRRRGREDAKSRAWFADQYRHPHESKHTYGEVHEWFDRTGIEFVRAVPSLAPEAEGTGGGGDLFHPIPRGTRFERFLIQGQEALRGSPEGGFFVFIGRKPGAEAPAGDGTEQAGRELAAVGGET